MTCKAPSSWPLRFIQLLLQIFADSVVELGEILNSVVGAHPNPGCGERQADDNLADLQCDFFGGNRNLVGARKHQVQV